MVYLRFPDSWTSSCHLVLPTIAKTSGSYASPAQLVWQIDLDQVLCSIIEKGFSPYCRCEWYFILKTVVVYESS
jgi:hypothetical protein